MTGVSSAEAGGELPASYTMVTDYLPAWCLAYKDRIWELKVLKTEVSYKSEMAGLFN